MHIFKGRWITDSEFYKLKPRNVFHKQLEPLDLPCVEHRNRHILFRKRFNVSHIKEAKVYITADDYYKLYINGKFAGQGPAPAYHFEYNYNVIDITGLLVEGENTIAVHTLYQGLVNRVWQSADFRHGLIMDVEVDGEIIVSSDESFKTRPHSGYREMSVEGIRTQFMEEYNSNSPEAGFEAPDFDDSSWENARYSEYADHILKEQKTDMLVFEVKQPVTTQRTGNTLTIDFGSNYVAYLNITAMGKKGDKVVIRCGQELDDCGRVRYHLRANCVYEEQWLLGDGKSVLDQFDYKAFRFVELVVPESCEITEVYLTVRHLPFNLVGKMNKEYAEDEKLCQIWDLCVHTQKYGVQEVIQDCMDREKGFYMGDGCYSALTNMLFTGDHRMVRKLIDDGFSSSFITEGLVTCLNCSHIQEIAEYPFMLISLVLWYYRLSGDREYLAQNYKKAVSVVDSYSKAYEKDGLLKNLDKWCVVEWPANFRDGYDVDITEGRVCEPAHISINAYYIEAVRSLNKIAKILGIESYRDEKPLVEAFMKAFYVPEKKLFKDSEVSDHISIVGNVFPFGFDLCPDDETRGNIMNMMEARKISSLSFFCTFVAFEGYIRNGREDMVKAFLLDEGAWLRMLREDATTTFEAWGKDEKKNASLFHLTFSYAGLFLSDTDLKKLFA